MKNLAIIIIFMLFVSSLNSQSKGNIVSYFNWSNPTSYRLSPSPAVVGYGALSDSLSKAHNDSTFFEHNGVYYPITCWADYYLWYVKKYWYYFNQPELYEYYYMAEDDYGMAGYICNNNFTGPQYPSRIAVSFPDKGIYCNNLSKSRIKNNLKLNTWDNKNYVAITESEKNKKSQAQEIGKDRSINSDKIYFKKYDSHNKPNEQSNDENTNFKSKQNSHNFESIRDYSPKNSNINMPVKGGNSTNVDRGNAQLHSTKTNKEK